MRSREPKVVRAADEIILKFTKIAETFDFVNIQLEHGTLCPKPRDFARRFKWIAESAPALSVTFHTVLSDIELDLESIVSDAARLRFDLASRTWKAYRARKAMNEAVYETLRREGRKKPVNVIVHTNRDFMTMRHAIGLPNVYQHPLSFFGEEDAADLRSATRRSDLPTVARMPADAVLLGVFGFLSEYKDFETAIHALRLLPDNYHLLFFGGVHPNEIRRNQKIYPYVQRLIEAAQASAPQTAGGMQVGSVANRIHFMGTQTDEDFAKGMCLCDCVILPYLEVGQSASGPMSIALEMGARVIAARNLAFLEFAKYHPGAIEMFEIGNHLELAHLILDGPRTAMTSARPVYSAQTNRALYVAANTRP